MTQRIRIVQSATGVCLLLATALAHAQADNASFFVTSENPGSGGDLGGIDGADAHCQALADSAGMGDKTWRAYLSTSDVDARDRIGDGPWYNVEGELIAEDVDGLHGDNNITNETAIDENGDVPDYLIMRDGEAVRAVEDSLVHDVFTGSNADGTAAANTCNDWTSGSSDATAMLGHADRLGRAAGVNSWNSVHDSVGCDMPSLVQTGGAGMYYCFAID